MSLVATALDARLRVKSLDSLRGIAAVIVVFHHCTLLYFSHGNPKWIKFSPLRLFNSGDGSVQVFFALSGFVLFLALRIGTGRFLYLPYLAKRFMRLYPPFAAAIFASAGLYDLIQPKALPELGYWFNHYSWNLQPTAAVIAGHLAMTDRVRLQGLDNVMWSLGFELRVSLLFPLLALCVWRNWLAAASVALIISAASRFVNNQHTFDLLYDPLQTLPFLFLFVGGAALALNASCVRQWLEGAAPWLRALLWAVALVSITLPLSLALGTIVGFAALLLVALCFGDPSADVVLSHGVLTWLGRISYSLYLVHLLVMLTVVHLFYGRAPLQYLLILAVLLSLVIAELAYRFVEKPCIDLGRWFASLLISSPSDGSRIGREPDVVGTGK